IRTTQGNVTTVTHHTGTDQLRCRFFYSINRPARTLLSSSAIIKNTSRTHRSQWLLCLQVNTRISCIDSQAQKPSTSSIASVVKFVSLSESCGVWTHPRFLLLDPSL